METMNATGFARSLNRLYQPYNESYTDSMVWWFASQPSSEQAEVIRKVCNSMSSAQTTATLFWNLTSTFYISKDAQEQMNGCNFTKTLTLKPPNPGALFPWNPFTPQALSWFSSQDELSQITAVDYVCYQSNFPKSLVLNTTQSWTRNSNIYSNYIAKAISECTDLKKILDNPYSNASLSWFSGQPPITQRNAIIRLCASTKFKTSVLSNIFENVLVSSYQETESVKTNCLLTRGNGTQLFWTTLPDSSKGLVWFASQTAGMQARVVANICMGYVLKPDMRLFTIPEIQDVFDVYTNYLNQTNSIRSGVVKAMIRCLPFYESLNFTKAVDSFDKPSTNVWVASQTVSVQAEYIRVICAYTAHNSTILLDWFEKLGILMPLDYSVRQTMVDCHKVRYVIEPFQRHMHAYFGFAVIAGVALVAFCGVLLWDLVAIKVKQSTVSRAIAPFNIALFVCCAMNLIDSIASYMIWKFSVYSRITNVYDSIAIQRRLYMVSECSIVIWILAYLYFSWMRSETILVQVWTRGVQLIRILFFASPFVILLPLIPEFISIAQGGGKVGRDYIEKSFILQAFASSYLLVLDAILLLTFTRYISTLEKEMKAATSRFLIIARGGVAATSFCLIFTSVSIAKAATAVNSEVFKLTMAGLQHTVTWCLLLMKVFLVMDSLAKTDKNKTIDRSTSAKHLRLTKSEGLEFQ